jgi:hypothetical protein
MIASTAFVPSQMSVTIGASKSQAALHSTTRFD